MHLDQRLVCKYLDSLLPTVQTEKVKGTCILASNHDALWHMCKWSITISVIFISFKLISIKQLKEHSSYTLPYSFH